jgi:dihydroorotate dehydrogenase (NAD+) catalytic subunit
MANLKVNICGIEFPNPIWTAAGPTGANAEMMLLAAEGGAGGLVAKTISVQPAQVPIPNIASPFPGSLLNAEKWSEIDYQKMIEVEFPAAQKAGIPIIASIGYVPDDLTVLSKALETSRTVDAIEFSIHYIEKDICSLEKTARAIKDHTTLPVLAKLSPSVTELDDAIAVLDPIVDGYVAINSVGPALDFDIETMKPVMGSEDGRGWLSGRAILPIGLHFVAAMAALTSKPIVGVGGIRNVTDVVKYLMAGASAVQISSTAILQGEKIYAKLTTDLDKWLSEHGYEKVSELTGAFQRREKGKLYILGEGPQLYPYITDEYCTFCDLCAKACMYHAIQFVDKKFVFNKGKCVSCGLCTTVCKQGALKMVEN